MPTAILIDDNHDALHVLQSDIQVQCPDLTIIGTADSVVSGAKLLRKHTPDILFLDIILGDGTGFDLLEIFPRLTSKVIFITASDEYAIKAFRFSAIDYLLKPYNPKHLSEAVSRATQEVTNSNESLAILKDTISNPESLPNRISLHSQDKIAVVEISKILRCESDINNTLFVLENGEKIYVTKTLKHFDTLLKEHKFMRVHQSHLINLNFLQEYIKREGGYIKMSNGDHIPVAVRKKASVIEMLSNL